MSARNRMNRSTHALADSSATLEQLGEREWLRRVRRWFARDSGRRTTRIGIGDDAAALMLGRGRGPLLVATDAMVEGVHFRWEWTSPRDLAAKALAVNLSDLAAMGACPIAALLALSLPAASPVSRIEAFFKGLRAEGRRWGCPLVGGDMTAAPQWSLAITVLGQPAVTGRVIRRDAARPGQKLYVTGRPGQAGAGLAALDGGESAPAFIRRFLRPSPRLAEAAALARACPDLAMIDVSDGVWNDADQLAEASGTGIELSHELLKPTPAMTRLAARLGIEDPIQWVLFGGEDYELLFSTDRGIDRLREAFARAGIKTPIHQIGEVVRGRGVRVRQGDRAIQLKDSTFKHFGLRR